MPPGRPSTVQAPGGGTHGMLGAPKTCGTEGAVVPLDAANGLVDDAGRDWKIGSRLASAASRPCFPGAGLKRLPGTSFVCCLLSTCGVGLGNGARSGNPKSRTSDIEDDLLSLAGAALSFFVEAEESSCSVLTFLKVVSTAPSSASLFSSFTTSVLASRMVEDEELLLFLASTAGDSERERRTAAGFCAIACALDNATRSPSTSRGSPVASNANIRSSVAEG